MMMNTALEIDAADLVRWREVMIAKEKLEEHLASQLNNEQKSSYGEGLQFYANACEEIPAVVETESNPVKYLTYNKLNIQEAAKMLCFYWEKRVELFGESKAYRSLLELSIFDKADRDFLRTGALVQLPDDEQGRGITFSDLSRNETDSEMTIQRCLFYFFTKFTAENDSQRCQHIVATSTLQDNRLLKADVEWFQRIEKCFPITVDAYHICCVNHTGKELPEDDKSRIPENLVKTGEEFTKLIHIHVANDAEQIQESLQQEGLTKQGLPESVGGSWSYDAYLARISLARHGDQTGESRKKRKALPDNEYEEESILPASLNVSVNASEPSLLSSLPFSVASMRQTRYTSDPYSLLAQAPTGELSAALLQQQQLDLLLMQQQRQQQHHQQNQFTHQQTNDNIELLRHLPAEVQLAALRQRQSLRQDLADTFRQMTQNKDNNS